MRKTKRDCCPFQQNDPFKHWKWSLKDSDITGFDYVRIQKLQSLEGVQVKYGATLKGCCHAGRQSDEH